MNFDWDENKNRINAAAHDRITFEAASKVFNDEWAIDQYDAVHSTATEKRFTIIGLSGNQLLRVTYTVIEVEGEEIIRLMSARQAQSKDKFNYETARNEYDR